MYVIALIAFFVSYEDAKKLTEKVLELENGNEVREEVRKFLKENLDMEVRASVETTLSVSM
ncbi:hypothetical protein E3E22_07360 [Thermococcus sp. MV5]|uniref:hypothetical protein n=1 Tax=Thermococcus sp. MV5 TaxID=1638272 RepID=UPI00143A2FCB|nr:hypothetical protein [Thermococcus sp. MV5]NJE26434.1 hypothetical protein [Thermococcus sp. MV5]